MSYEDLRPGDNKPDQTPLSPRDKIALFGLGLVLAYIAVGNAWVVFDSFRDKIQLP